MTTPHPEIKPILIGKIAYQDQNNSWNEDINRLYFLEGYNIDDNIGQAMVMVFIEGTGTCLKPVSRIITSSDGKEIHEPLVFEGFAGLCCRYDQKTGTLKDFYED